MIRKRFLKAFLLFVMLGSCLAKLEAIQSGTGCFKNIVQASDSFYSASNNDILGFDGTVTISGPVYVMANRYNLTVTVTRADTTVQPYNVHPTWASWFGKEFGHLIFYAAQDKTITVSCSYDLNFTGSYSLRSDGVTPSSHKWEDLIVTFSGQGQTKFVLADHKSGTTRGVNVSFTGKGGVLSNKLYRAGTRVYITMDQTETQAVTNGNNKVLFQRMDRGTTGYEGYPTGIIVGQASVITFISVNGSGLSSDDYANGDFGAIAFDPTHSGAGRMFLKIEGATNNPNKFLDGGVLVSGNYVIPDEDAEFTETNIRCNVYMDASAGRRAIFRVIDGQAYTAGGADYDPADSARRGLLVINENTSVQKFASDLYYDYANVDETSSEAYDYMWLVAPYNRDMYKAVPGAYRKAAFPTFENDTYTYLPYDPYLNVRPGFVVGTNGRMDIYHKTFFDYVAMNTSSHHWDTYEQTDLANETLHDPTIAYAGALKHHNPAALIFDGLAIDSNYNYPDEIAAEFAVTDVTSDDYNPAMIAQVVTYGDGRLYSRCGVNSLSRRANYGPFFNTSNELVYTFTIDHEDYTGDYMDSELTTTNEGEQVIDVEGQTAWIARPAQETPNRPNYDVEASVLGTVNMPTIEIDYTGREYRGFNTTDSDYIAPASFHRALNMDSDYYIYNSPSIIMNAMLQLYDGITLSHSDVTKEVLPNTSAQPAIVGGEKKSFLSYVYSYEASEETSPASNYYEDYEFPKLKLVDGSILDLHENLAVSGIRVTQTEKIYDLTEEEITTDDKLEDASANSTGIIKYRDHGDNLDTLFNGYGRIFILGSTKNATIDGNTDATLASAFTNAYKSQDTDAQTIRLSIQSSEDYRPTSDTTWSNDIASRLEKAYHLFLNQDTSSTEVASSVYTSLGWTTTVGNSLWNPWDGFTSGSNEFAITANNEAPGTLSVDGKHIYFSGTNSDGDKISPPVVYSDENRVIYANHGGDFAAGQPVDADGNPDWTLDGYDCFIDTILATQLWKTDATYGNNLSGIIDLPKDQVIFGDSFSAQPYGIDTSLTGTVRLNVFNRNYSSTLVDPNTGRQWYDRDSGEEVTIPWRYRGYDAAFEEIKNTKASNLPNLKKALTRFVASPEDSTEQPNPAYPCRLPNDLLYVSADQYGADHISQLKVAGATAADPFHFLASGYATGYGHGTVDEFVSIPSTPEVRGEGAHAAIFINNGGTVGLGTLDLNINSDRAWNILGKDYITVCPDGNGTVILNSDLIVSDILPIVPTVNFGNSTTETQRLTFFAPEAHEFRVRTGQTLDLSAFGQAKRYMRQEIEFAGKVRLVFEPGSALRFPDLSDWSINNSDVQYPTLYMNDDTELVFEGTTEMVKGRYQDITSTDTEKIKIYGCGQIWLNKQAKCTIFDNAKVSVRCDDLTEYTDLWISLKRQAQFLIGDENRSGGSLEFGNPGHVALDESTHAVSVNLTVDGPDATFRIDREGFLGFGVGVINKDGVPNGIASSTNNPAIDADYELSWNPDATKAWQVRPLTNLFYVMLNFINGNLDHSNIYDGSDSRSSLIAFGPFADYDDYYGGCEIETDIYSTGNIFGGGNIVRVDALNEDEEAAQPYVNIWSYNDATPANSNGTYDATPRTDGTMYGMLSCGDIITRPSLDTDNFNHLTIEDVTNGVYAVMHNGVSYNTYEDLFQYFATPDQRAADWGKNKAVVGITNGTINAGYVYSRSDTQYPIELKEFGINTYREELPSTITGGLSSNAVDLGYVGVDQVYSTTDLKYSLPKLVQ